MNSSSSREWADDTRRSPEPRSGSRSRERDRSRSREWADDGSCDRGDGGSRRSDERDPPEDDGNSSCDTEGGDYYDGRGSDDFLGGSSLLRGVGAGLGLSRGPFAPLSPTPWQSGFTRVYSNFSQQSGLAHGLSAPFRAFPQHTGLAGNRFAPLPNLSRRSAGLRGVGLGGPPLGLRGGLSGSSFLRGGGAGQRRVRFSADLILGPTAASSTVTGKRKRAAPVTTASPPRAVRFSKRIRGNELAASAAAAGPGAATARRVVRPNLRASRRIVN